MRCNLEMCLETRSWKRAGTFFNFMHPYLSIHDLFTYQVIGIRTLLRAHISELSVTVIETICIVKVVVPSFCDYFIQGYSQRISR